MRDEFTGPGFDPEKEITVVHNPEGKFIAFGYVAQNPTTHSRGFGDCAVHPDYRGQGIGKRLIEEGDTAHLAKVGSEFDDETPITVQRWAGNQEPTSVALFESAGYQLVRHFYTMRIEFKEPLQAATMPEGFELRPFDVERDGHEVHQAQQEAFRDHWGHTEDVSWDIWKHRFESPHFQPDMWYIAWAGDEVAGVSMCNAAGEGRDDVAWVGALGVRRAYRNRGLAKALLLHSFYDAQQRGFTSMELGVDAANPTGALGLYERAGMHTSLVHSNYRKVLRGNAELIKD
jgi:mycothiol synthase